MGDKEKKILTKVYRVSSGMHIQFYYLFYISRVRFKKNQQLFKNVYLKMYIFLMYINIIIDFYNILE